MAKLTKNQLDILDHAVYRAIGGYYCGDDADMKILVDKGLMRSAGPKPFVPDEYFTITPLGKQVLQQPPKE